MNLGLTQKQQWHKNTLRTERPNSTYLRWDHPSKLVEIHRMALLVPLACALGAVHGSETTAERFKLSDASSEAAELHSCSYLTTETTLSSKKVKKCWLTSQKTPVVPLNWSSAVARCTGSSDAFIPLAIVIDTSLKCTEMAFAGLLLTLFANCYEWEFNVTNWMTCWFLRSAIFGCFSSSNFIKELAFRIKADTLNSHIKKHNRQKITQVNYAFHSSYVVKQSAWKMISVNSECITMTRRCLLTFKPFR